MRDYCKLRKKKIILSNNLKISKQLKFDGVYLPSFNKKIVRSDNVKKDFFIIGSAHNLKEIREKENQGVNQIFISPLFKTKNKKNLGIYKFNQLNSLTNKKVIALGGINNNNLNKLKLIKVDGFASISYIQNKYDK